MPKARVRVGAASMPHRLWTRRLPRAAAAVAGLVCALVLGLDGSAAQSAAGLQEQISAARSATGSLHAQISAETRRIGATSGGLAGARARLGRIQTDLDNRIAALRRTQDALLASRARLISLENRLHLAIGALAANLRAGYEGVQPNLMSVVLNAHGFGDLLDPVGFMARVAHQDTRIVGLTRAARTASAARLTGSTLWRSATAGSPRRCWRAETTPRPCRMHCCARSCASSRPARRRARAIAR